MQDLRRQIADEAATLALAEALVEAQQPRVRRARNMRIGDQLGDPRAHAVPAFCIEQAGDAPTRRRHQLTQVLKVRPVQGRRAPVSQPLLNQAAI